MLSWHKNRLEDQYILQQENEKNLRISRFRLRGVEMHSSLVCVSMRQDKTMSGILSLCVWISPWAQSRRSQCQFDRGQGWATQTHKRVKRRDWKGRMEYMRLLNSYNNMFFVFLIHCSLNTVLSFLDHSCFQLAGWARGGGPTVNCTLSNSNKTFGSYLFSPAFQIVWGKAMCDPLFSVLCRVN